jgi:UDP-N-acetylmuramoylalanine--D-glutamate ligase
MIDYKQYFADKKITLMRIGLLGRGIGDAAFLAECGAEILVVDSAPQTVMQPAVDALKKYSNITFKFGPYDLGDFRHTDMVLKGAGTPIDSPEIAAAREAGVPVVMSTALFAQLSGATVVGITGTRGKSTTTHLLYEIIKASGRRVWLGGNVVGMSTLALLPQVQTGDLAVLELDSWQLQGFGDLKLSPHLAIFTNLMPDHLNYYGGSMEKYFADKANIFKYQKQGDYLLVGAELPGALPAHAERVAPFSKDWETKLPGEHNKINVALAVRAAEILEVPEDVIKQTTESFCGVPGRLELVREWRGIKIYNDTTATTPAAALAALKALGSEKKLVLIAGGADKNIDMSEFVAALPQYCKRVVWLPGTGTDKLALPNMKVEQNLAEAFATALAVCESGDTLLLSPGFASFGLFKNEFDRGEQFNRLVKNLK